MKMTKLQATGVTVSLGLLAAIIGLIINQRAVCAADDKSCNDSILSVCSISLALVTVGLIGSIASCIKKDGEVRRVAGVSANNLRPAGTIEERAILAALAQNPNSVISESASHIEELAGLLSANFAAESTAAVEQITVAVAQVQTQTNQGPVDNGAGTGAFSARALANTPESKSTEDAVVLE
ncbi:MAG: hypothetical protein Q7V63_04540 [Gammaproteobacteria bacterium]|nr:hypothetical protein [Gammaproteobacteria bacterium]